MNTPAWKFVIMLALSLAFSSLQAASEPHDPIYAVDSPSTSSSHQCEPEETAASAQAMSASSDTEPERISSDNSGRDTTERQPQIAPVHPQTHSATLTYTRLHALLAQENPHLTPTQKRTLLKDALHEHDLLAAAWAIALALSVGIYLILDGADLGAGILSLFYNDTSTRAAIMASMAGTWDANETWLVVAGGILFGGFPFVYGSVFSYLLFPLMLVLLAIILRAIALEFHHHADRSRRWWGWSFGLGSLFVALAVGMVGGAVINGIPLRSVEITYAGGGCLRLFTGGLFDFLSPFSVWTGLVGIVTAILAGSLYLRARFQKHAALRHQVLTWMTGSFWVLIAALVATAGWMYLRFHWVAQKWGGPFGWAWSLAGLWIAYVFYRLWNASRRERDFAALVWFAAAIASILATVGVTLYPWLVPGSWTIYSGADPSLSLVSFTFSMGGFIPVILVYNWYQLWVFRARISSITEYGRG